MKPTKDSLGEHAIVIGGSIAGMSQAAVLCRYFSRVTILETDMIDKEKPASRNGVMQDKHLHGLLNRGLLNLDKNLPGLRRELLASGASETEYGKNVCWFMNGTWWSQQPSGIIGLGFTRPHFEFYLRKRLLAENNLAFLCGATVSGYSFSADHSAVTGVEFSLTSTNEKQTLEADLVVDCSGRFSKTIRWFEQLTAQNIPKEEIDIDVHYTTQLMRFEQNPSWKTIYIATNPPQNKRLGAIIKAEDDIFVLCLAGYLGDTPPKGRDEILLFLQSLASPALAQVYPKMIPITEPVRYRFKSDLRRYFSKVGNLPENLLFAGDLVCSFDPVYGQGMTTATLGAEVLNHCLSRRKGKNANLSGLTREFHRAQDKMLDSPWLQAITSDLRFTEVQGRRSPLIRFMMIYSSLVFSTMHLPWVHDRVIPIFNMLKSPTAFFNPYLLWAALNAKLGLIQPDDKTPTLLR